MIVNCAHAVPVRYVPPRARSEHVAFFRSVTPVELRTLKASEFTRVDYLAQEDSLYRESQAGDWTTKLYERDGTLWHKLETLGWDDGELVREYFSRESFVAILEGQGYGRGDFGKHFARTPLAAPLRALGSWRGEDADVVFRGTAMPTEGPYADRMARSRIVADYADEAQSALHALFAEDVALVGRGVLVRIPGPMIVQDTRRSRLANRVTLFPRMLAFAGMACHLDRLPELLDLQQRFDLFQGLDGGIPGHTRIPRRLLGDDDVGTFIADMPAVLHEAFHDLRRRDPHWHRTASGKARDLAERLAREVPLSEIGAMPSDGPEGRLCGILDDIEVVRGLPDCDTTYLAYAAAYVEEIALPRLRASSTMTPEDAESLVGLGPS